ncbi:MAG: cobalamin biosynthesis central domain-containing protein [Oscillospiraceae bacterium]
MRSVYLPGCRKKTTRPGGGGDRRGGLIRIPDLEGHVGGANELARQVAQCLDAVAVVTTATDVNQKFAVDVFAEKNRMVIHSMAKAKEISAAVLAGHPVGLHTRLPLCGSLPPELTPGRVQRENIEISCAPNMPTACC